MNPNAPDTTQDRGDSTGLAPESGARDAAEAQDAAGAARQNDVSNDIGQGDVTLSQEEMLGLQSPLAEQGIDLGSLPGTIMAGASQSKPKPGAGQAVSGNKEDPVGSCFLTSPKPAAKPKPKPTRTVSESITQ